MSTNDDTPATDYDSIGTEDLINEWLLLEDASDEEVAQVLDGQEAEAREAIEAVRRALLDDGEPLTDDAVWHLARVGNAMRALSDTLSPRVPDRHRAEYDGE